MNIVIVGGGNLGFFLAHLLVDENHDVTIIEKQEDRCKYMANELDIEVIRGDGTNTKILEKASVAEADALIAITNSDEANMVSSLMAKELGAKSVACRLRKIDYDEAVLKKLGIDIVIHPEAAAAGYIAELITKPEVLDLAFISRGAAEIMEIGVKEGMKIVGKSIGEIEHPSGSAIIAVYTDQKEFVIPELTYRIQANSKILVLAKREAVDLVRKQIN